MEKIRIGILGAGSIFESHARGLVLNEEYVDVVAIANAVLDEKTRERACNLLKKEKNEITFYSDYKDLIDHEDVNAVIVLLPHMLHMPASVYASNHHMHVLIEKPMARSTYECDRMIEAAEKNKVSLVVCHDRRYNDEWRAVKEITDSGRIGEPLFYRLEHNQNYAPDENSWVRNAEMLGGGAIMSCLTHQIDALRWIGGEMKEVTCMSKIIPERMEGECIAIIAGKMKNDALAELAINWHTISDVSVNTINPIDNALWFEFIHVCGTKGEVYYLANKGVYLLEYKTPGGANEYSSGLKGFLPYFQGGNVFGHNNIITEWVKLLRGDSDNIVTYGTDSRNTIAIAEAAYMSVKEKRVISVDNK